MDIPAPIAPIDWNPTETLFAFVGWLSTRDEAVVIGAAFPVTDIVQLIHDFGMQHGLGGVREGWDDGLVK